MFNPYIVKNNNIWTVMARDSKGNIWAIIDFNEQGVELLGGIYQSTQWNLDGNGVLQLTFLEETIDSSEEM